MILDLLHLIDHPGIDSIYFIYVRASSPIHLYWNEISLLYHSFHYCFYISNFCPEPEDCLNPPVKVVLFINWQNYFAYNIHFFIRQQLLVDCLFGIWGYSLMKICFDFYKSQAYCLKDYFHPRIGYFRKFFNNLSD